MIASNDVRRVVLALLLLVSGRIHAEALPDPTRPPMEAGAAASEVRAPSGPLLQSILISPHRKAAMIDGKTVLLGERFAGGVLVGIGEGEVTVRTGGELKTLRLFPGVIKRSVKEKP